MYNETEMKIIEFTDSISTVKRPICPECVDHVQGETGDVFDCKNLYRYRTIYDLPYSYGSGTAQCCCYSISHGKNTR